MGLTTRDFTLNERPMVQTDTDPQILELNYISLFEQSDYLPQRVLIEVGARSLKEPAENRFLQSFIGQNFIQFAFSDKPFIALCVNPQRTFIEKVLLLHEVFIKETGNLNPNRMSRHLYDIHRMMDTDFGLKAVKNSNLFQTIVVHRQKYTRVRGIDYALHTPQTINFIPDEHSFKAWKQDYQIMKSNMIYGDAPSFEVLLKRMEELKVRFRQMTII